MMEKLNKLLSIKNADGVYMLDADEVAKIVGKSRNAVYESRKAGEKLDKLAIFEKVKEIVKENNESATVMQGDKIGLLNGLDGVFENGARYKVSVQEL